MDESLEQLAESIQGAVMGTPKPGTAQDIIDDLCQNLFIAHINNGFLSSDLEIREGMAFNELLNAAVTIEARQMLLRGRQLAAKEALHRSKQISP